MRTLSICVLIDPVCARIEIVLHARASSTSVLGVRVFVNFALLGVWMFPDKDISVSGKKRLALHSLLTHHKRGFPITRYKPSFTDRGPRSLLRNDYRLFV